MRKLLSSVSAFALVMLTSALALAQEGGGSDGGWGKAAVAIAIGLAALAGTTGQSRAAAAALEGIARNPNAAGQIFVPMILGLAFIESLVILTWLMQFTFG